MTYYIDRNPRMKTVTLYQGGFVETSEDDEDPADLANDLTLAKLEAKLAKLRA